MKSLRESIFTTEPEDITTSSIIFQHDKLKEYNSHILGMPYSHDKDTDVFGNKLKRGDWCLMPLSVKTSWQWRIALIVNLNGQLVPASVDPSIAQRRYIKDPDSIKVQYHRGIGCRDCIKIEDIDEFMKNLK